MGTHLLLPTWIFPERVIPVKAIGSGHPKTEKLGKNKKHRLDPKIRIKSLWKPLEFPAVNGSCASG